jgi:replicative superfamily II helicase
LANYTPEEQVLIKSLQEIPYIGPVKAKQLYEAGVRSPRDLREGGKWFEMLSPQQKSAVLYDGHLKEEVGRDECVSVLVCALHLRIFSSFLLSLLPCM